MNTDKEKYYPKELSWLAFNQRVLQEAGDKNNPVIERIRFLGIFSSNLDEFYRVRVAEVKRNILILSNKGETENAAEQTSIMEDIQNKVVEHTAKFESIYADIVKVLKRYNICIDTQSELTEYQTKWARKFFTNKVLRHIAPVLLHNKVDLVSRLNDSCTYLFVAIHVEEKSTKYAVIEVPAREISRFVVIPPQKSRKQKHIILLDDIVKICLPQIFKGFVEFDSIEAYSFQMTRDSEYSINDEIDESFVEKMSLSMKQRLSAEPVRINYDGNMPDEMLHYLKRRLKLSSIDGMVPGGTYRNFKDFISFPNEGRDYLENPELPAISTKDFTNFDTVFDAIKHKDILLHYPYHRYLHFTEFVRQAAFDPSVKHIRINIYRVAKNSRIVNSLIDAVDNGKSVTVLVELRARFDEENNIEWAKKMKDAGIKVVFGVPSLKVHCKLCVVSRKEKGHIVRYVHFGTGNFNEKTAKIYTDMSLFTCNQELAKEAVEVFDFIQTPYLRHKFKHLLLSPLNSRTKIYLLIRQEIQNAKDGLKSGIIIKFNNLVDQKLIDELYKAGQAGVKIKMIIRGMCALKPGVKGLSENISVISIVDRFLEHPRIMVFENNGDNKIFISSADWMTRNMDQRVEVGCPIYDPDIKRNILNILDIQFQDTLKARVIDANQKNNYVRRGNRKKMRSQLEIYDYLKRLEKNV